MEKHKIGNTYECNGGKYTLIKGGNCEQCVLYNKDELCHQMPPCEQHEGHYIKADAGDNAVLNIQRVSNLAKFCTKIAKQKDCPPEFIKIVNKEFWNLI